MRKLNPLPIRLAHRAQDWISSRFFALAFVEIPSDEPVTDRTVPRFRPSRFAVLFLKLSNLTYRRG